jgi:zinc protease
MMTRLISRWAAVLLLAIGLPAAAQSHRPAPALPAHKPAPAKPAERPRVFPYQIQSRTLPNGLSVVVIRTPEFKDMVTYATAVFAGSGKETQQGKTGLAHLFEHIIFLHQYGGEPDGYQKQIRRMGAHNNASTNYDMTFYHPTTFTANLRPSTRADGPLPGLIELEASRFKGLKLDRKQFETEAGAVLGEYRRIFSFPQEKMVEAFSPKAFPNHPYGHTVIGYYDDVVNMPKAWDAAWEFYRNYYAPNDVAIIVAGDVNPDQILADVTRAYADWKPSKLPAIPAEQEPTAEQKVHVDWEADVAPQLMVAYHTPAMKPGTREGAVTAVLPELLTSRSSPLFQQLMYQKQSVTDLGMDTGETLWAADPHLMLIGAELVLEDFRKRGEPYVGDVQSDIVQGVDALKNFSRQPNAAQTLAVIKSKVKNDFLASLDSTGSIAETFATCYRLSRDPNVFEQLLGAVDALTPADIDAYAAKYFTPQRRVITTLWHPQTAKSSAEVKQ